MTVQNSRALGFGFGFVVFVFINVVQIGVNYSISAGDVSYGFPYPFYAYFTMANRGRFWIFGMIADLIFLFLFAVVSAFLFPLFFRYKNSRSISITQTPHD